VSLVPAPPQDTNLERDSPSWVWAWLLSLSIPVIAAITGWKETNINRALILVCLFVVLAAVVIIIRTKRKHA